MTTWKLGNGVERNRLHPDTFHIPSDYEKSMLEPGDLVKLMFEFESEDGFSGERMWVKIVTAGPSGLFAGALCNHPVVIDSLGFGDPVLFTADEVIGIEFTDEGHQTAIALVKGAARQAAPRPGPV